MRRLERPEWRHVDVTRKMGQVEGAGVGEVGEEEPVDLGVAEKVVVERHALEMRSRLPVAQAIGPDPDEFAGPVAAIDERLLVAGSVEVPHKMHGYSRDVGRPTDVRFRVKPFPVDDERGGIGRGHARDEAWRLSAAQGHLAILGDLGAEDEVGRAGRRAVMPLDVRAKLPRQLHLAVG